MVGKSRDITDGLWLNVLSSEDAEERQPFATEDGS